MTLEQLQNLIACGESETFEYKETTGQRGEACRTLCAFLNGNGGTVVFGVSRKGKLTGQIVSDSTRRDLSEAFSKFEPAVDVEARFVPVTAERSAIVCTVPQGPHRPYLYDGRAYRRIQSSTTAMPQELYEIFLASRGEFRSEWERTPNPDLTLADLDLDEIIRTARMSISAGRLDASTDTTNPMGLLAKFGLARNGVLLNGAIVLFGKDFTLYPQCHLKMAWFKGTDKTHFLDSADVHGNIFRLFDAAMAFCFKHLNLSGEVRGMYREERLEIPVEALREAIINALAHRLYVVSGSAVSLAVYDDRVEIANPGAFPPDIPMETIDSEHESIPRNPRIAEVLYKRKTIEAWGRGIRLILDACAAAGIPAPRFQCDGRFVKTVFMRVATETSRAPSSNTPSASPSSTTSNTPSIPPSSTPSSVSADSPGTEGSRFRLTSHVRMVLAALLTGEFGNSQLLAYFGLKDRKWLHRHYIGPALRDGLIARTEPESPRSPTQKYCLTAKGRAAISSSVDGAEKAAQGADPEIVENDTFRISLKVPVAEAEKAASGNGKANSRGEKLVSGSKKLVSTGEKLVFDGEKLVFQGRKLVFKSVSKPTLAKIAALFDLFGTSESFGYREIATRGGLPISSSIRLLGILRSTRLVVPVNGPRRGQYRFSPETANSTSVQES